MQVTEQAVGTWERRSANTRRHNWGHTNRLKKLWVKRKKNETPGDRPGALLLQDLKVESGIFTWISAGGGVKNRFLSQGRGHMGKHHNLVKSKKVGGVDRRKKPRSGGLPILRPALITKGKSDRAERRTRSHKNQASWARELSL